MRNYLRMQVLRHYTDPDTAYVCWGGTDEQLAEYSRRLQAIVRAGNPTVQFRIPPPQVVWFELNQENFGLMLNVSSGEFFTLTRASNDISAGDVDVFGDSLYDMTRVEVEGSPRGTWSHGH